MSSFIYDHGREGFLDGSINWNSDTIKAVLVGGGYTAAQATDINLADLPGDQLIATSSAFGTKGVAAGVASAANIVFSAVGGVTDGHYIVVFQDTGDSTTSRLIAYIDDAVNLPITPNGGDITVSWDSGPDRIFKL